MADRPFQVIEGTPAPDTPRERQRARLKLKAPSSIIRCHRCSSNAVIVVKLGMHFSNGKPAGGQKSHICAQCFQQGEYVVVA